MNRVESSSRYGTDVLSGSVGFVMCERYVWAQASSRARACAELGA